MPKPRVPVAVHHLFRPSSAALQVSPHQHFHTTTVRTARQHCFVHSDRNASSVLVDTSATPARRRMSSTAAAMDSDSPTRIRVFDRDGRSTYRSILRSYPKGKPENLVTGLERLLSYHDRSTSTSTSNTNSHRWHLSQPNDAIHLTLVIHDPEAVTKLISSIKQASTDLHHDPHYSYSHHLVHDSTSEAQQQIFAITCTTHVPYGLSLKDVKLATSINKAIHQINTTSPNPPISAVALDDPKTDSDIVIASWQLTAQNEEAARLVREDPESACNVAAKGRATATAAGS